MRRIDHPPRPDKNPHMLNAISAIAVLAPEDHIAGFSLGAGQVLAEGGVVLSLGGAGDGEAFGFADGVLGETWRGREERRVR